MEERTIFIYIISKDQVFANLMSVMFKQFSSNAKIKVFRSLFELKDFEIITEPDLIVLVDLVDGAASLEVLSYLRETAQLKCSIYYFGEDVYDVKMKVISNGANYFYTKPFHPRIVTYEMANNWNSIKQNEFNPNL